MSEQWGVGNKKDALAFGTALVRGKPVELIRGEHPHSRHDNSHYARFEGGRIIGFSGHRICAPDWDIEDAATARQIATDRIRLAGWRAGLHGRQPEDETDDDTQRALYLRAYRAGDIERERREALGVEHD